MRPADRRPAAGGEGAGRLLARSGAGPAALEVREDDRSRWLAFARGPVQSLMDRADPIRLVLPYTRALVSPLLFGPVPRRVWLLGLGGGSVLRFLHRHLPAARFVAVERRRDVVDLAREHFAAPVDDARVRTVVADAREVLAGAHGTADLVLIDLFDQRGLPSWVRAPAPYRRVRALLAPTGIVAANLWVDADDEFLTVIGGLREVFDGRVAVLAVRGFRNLVALGFAGEPRPVALADLGRRARRLHARTGLDFPALVRTLAECNLVDSGRLVL